MARSRAHASGPEGRRLFVLDPLIGARGTRLRRQLTVTTAVIAMLALGAPVMAAKAGPLGHFKHIVVIYEENHSFDNLYGLWGDVNGQHVVGLADADAPHTTQVDWQGNPYQCLLQTDVNMRTTAQSYPGGVAGHLTESCTQTLTLENGSSAPISSAFGNAPYLIDDFIGPTDVTCPPLTNLFGFSNGIDKTNPAVGATAGGCTRDLVHRFYQEQYQLNGGNQNRYITGSDSAAMTFGYYDTTKLPIYTYLHANGAPKYVIADHFFQAAFGGSFLNHQFLIAAAAPSFAGSHSVLDAAGMPRGQANGNSYPLYKTANTAVNDGNTTQACGLPTTVAGLACGDYAVNTVLPYHQPTSQGFAVKLPADIPDTTTPMTIGDLLSNKGVSWAYYGGGWDNAAGNVYGLGYTNQTNGTPGGSCSDPDSVPAVADGGGLNAGWPYCPDRSFQQHHYPFAYFARYAPGTQDRADHLLDEQNFFAAAAAGNLPAVSFVKPVGSDNEHPGYASEPNGSNHLLNLIQAVMNGPEAGNTLIVVTYDEFGGQWDHVPPPSGTDPAAHDEWGPGTRIPAILIARSFSRSGVDHTYLDTTSILRTIEEQWSLGDLGHRDAIVNSLANAISLGRPN